MTLSRRVLLAITTAEALVVLYPEAIAALAARGGDVNDARRLAIFAQHVMGPASHWNRRDRRHARSLLKREAKEMRLYAKANAEAHQAQAGLLTHLVSNGGH